ncbi:MAG: hypothetical protein ACLQPH_15530 [Acidimicrobiales bacterium]
MHLQLTSKEHNDAVRSAASGALRVAVVVAACLLAGAAISACASGSSTSITIPGGTKSTATTMPAGAIGTWSNPTGIDPMFTILSVSCPTTTDCVAVDGAGNASGTASGGNYLVFNGTSWTNPVAIDSSAHASAVGVSCPTTTFCAAVDNGGNAFTYSGSTWTPTTTADSNQLEAVSCASSTFCVAVDNSGGFISWNGTSWGQESVIDNSSNGNTIFRAVSCPTTTFCAAVDDNGAFTYNGSTWSSLTPLGGNNDSNGEGPPDALSCASAKFCLAAGNDGGIYEYNGSAWSTKAKAISSDDSVVSPTSLSCTFSLFCMGIDNGANRMVIYNGSSWSAPVNLLNLQVINAVSCATSSFCVVVDQGGNAATWKR